MLVREQAQKLFESALAEFARDWQIAGACIELSLHDPEHWASGLGTFGLVLRNRKTGAAKILGWRNGEFRNATYHRGISYRVLEAYADRIIDPIRRYFDEVGIVVGQPIRSSFLGRPTSGTRRL